jgi:hypothetical protein
MYEHMGTTCYQLCMHHWQDALHAYAISHMLLNTSAAPSSLALTAALVLLLARERVVYAELVRVFLRDGLDLVVVQLGIAVGGAHEQPRQACEPAQHGCRSSAQNSAVFGI